MSKKAIFSIGVAIVLSGCGDKYRPSLLPPAPPPPALAPLPVPMAEKVTRFTSTVHFETDSAVLDYEARSILQDQAAWLIAHPDIVATIEGNCDLRESKAYNLILGMDRAVAVREFLIEAGVSPSRLTAVSNGELHPVASGTDTVSLALNRRAVTIVP